jgi:hypothetical protein
MAHGERFGAGGGQDGDRRDSPPAQTNRRIIGRGVAAGGSGAEGSLDPSESEQTPNARREPVETLFIFVRTECTTEVGELREVAAVPAWRTVDQRHQIMVPAPGPGEAPEIGTARPVTTAI